MDYFFLLQLIIVAYDLMILEQHPLDWNCVRNIVHGHTVYDHWAYKMTRHFSVLEGRYWEGWVFKHRGSRWSLCSHGHCCSFCSRPEVDGPVDGHLFSVTLQRCERWKTPEHISLQRQLEGFSKDFHMQEEGDERAGNYVFFKVFWIWQEISPRFHIQQSLTCMCACVCVWMRARVWFSFRQRKKRGSESEERGTNLQLPSVEIADENWPTLSKQ